MAEYEYHPLANIFPLIEGQAYTELLADVLKFGVREPVWLYEGKILDGRNRYRAAKAMGVDCPVRVYEGQDAASFVVSLNLHRRHLSESQRAMVAAKLATLPAHRPADNPANLPTSITQADAAELLNVSDRSIRTAKKVMDEAPAEVVKAVEQGAMAVSLAAQVAELPPEEQELVANVPQEDMRDVARQVVKAHVANNSGNNEWYTPSEYIQLAREVMGGIDTDPASSEIANRTVGAEVFYTVDDNGLEQQWSGRVWMNPPYAQPLIADFAEAVASKYETGEIEEACVLVNNGTETAWFQRILEVASAVCFPKARIKFIDPSGNPSGAPLQGQAILYLGPKQAEFEEAFGTKGKVLFNA